MKALIILTLFTLASCEKQKYVDPFKALDQHFSQAFSYHYLWPWNQLMKAAALLDEDNFNEPQVTSDTEKMEITLNVKKFKPEELKVRVKNRYIIVEGKQNMDADHRIMANHFVQRFVLPAGSKQEEVSAVLKETGVLSITVPRHEVPPPPPEREVPIEVIAPATTEKPEEIPEKKTDKPPKKASEIPVKSTETPTKETVTEKQAEVEKKAPVVTSPATPLEQLDLVEVTTHVGKIRKKELKETKTSKDNEVTKERGVDNNGLDYALIDSE